MNFDEILRIIVIFVIASTMIAVVFVIKAIIYDKKHPELYKDEDKRKEFGDLGENVVAKKLEAIAKNNHGHLINDFHIVDSGGKELQIDHLLFVSSGLYVIETKNYEGIISGELDNDKWLLTKDNITKEVNNPIKQNEMHIKRLKKLLNDNYPKMYNIVIFVNGDVENVKNSVVFSLDDGIKYLNEKASESFYSFNYVENMSVKIYNLIDRFKKGD